MKSFWTMRFNVIIFMALSPSLLCRESPKLDQIYDSHSQSGGESRARLEDKIYDRQPVPVFDAAQSGDVTAILGKTAILNCRVGGVGNRTVSWIRHADTHLLTAGRYTYTSDMRFRAIHKVLSEDYLLQILPVQAGDRGVYECQVSTTPVMSHHVILNVAEPITEILGGPNIYLEEGNNLNLTCLVKDSPVPPQWIFWYRNSQPISHSSSRGGVSQITEKGASTTSSLLVRQATLADSAQYACHASVGSGANVTVHVIRSADPEKWLPSEARRLLENISELLLMILLSFTLFHSKIF